MECRIYDWKRYGVGSCDEEKVGNNVSAGNEMERQQVRRIRGRL